MSGDAAVSGRVAAAAVAVVGGGPAGLMAAEHLARAGVSVTIYERMPSVGRKFLLAGRGGLNLTHSEPPAALLDRYGAARPRLEAALAVFGQDDLRAWCAGLGETTFVGSSGRIFPASFRATPLLRAWLVRLRSLGVQVQVRRPWTGWAEPSPGIVVAGGDDSATATVVQPDAVVLAVGGASWPRVGSDGAWVPIVRAAGVAVAPLRPSNCGFTVAWSPTFATRFGGTPLKNVELAGAGRQARGEALITSTGIEGGAVYALSAALRDALEDGPVTLTVDLRPELSVKDLTVRLERRRPKDSTATILRRAGLAPVAAGLMREASGGHLPVAPAGLAALAKAVPVPLLAPQPIARAISSAGGITFDEIDERFMLRRRPGTFVAGEMLDWEAPTGGYLLQATFSTAVAAASGLLEWLDEQA